ncbi:hypothetical protein SPSIL_055500 [Sporomusa silvacetica DSM 10669]|uniref:Uncharacterized protein n=1 Tax=Sporomusa silvacetica DSM 10669 TaxID=1123289 RepID=A0ABZ3IV68_9FIRM|nr:hypothetical protein [Sporomusa silvacetica]OZC16622.1 hypothetical protein SPSIL_36580 [Sporomusa silvacetica DSM 10669]
MVIGFGNNIFAAADCWRLIYWQEFYSLLPNNLKNSKGDNDMESQYFWMSLDDLEQVVIGNGEILLINKNGESTRIGTTVDEARKRLIDFGKDEDFPDFMNDYNG